MSDLSINNPAPPVKVDDHIVCVTLADGTKSNALRTYNEKSGDFSFFDSTGDITASVDSWSAGACEKSVPQCVESQEWTYGIDNTGTRFNDVATYCFELSDGSTLEWSQDGSSTSWTPQLNEWNVNVQQAADDAGLQWFVDSRYVTATNLTGGGGGLPGAPSEAIGQTLYDGGMRWRYLNIQICPGQPVPVRAYRKTSALFGDGEYNLTSAGAVLGPVSKFWLCVDCNGEDAGSLLWLKEDPDNTGELIPAEAGEIPNCWEPCGTLALAAAPPDRECTFEIDVACDNNNSANTVDFTNTITRRATVCNGEQIAVDYFQADPADPAALVPYTLVGDFVDCATGEAIAPPPQPCEDFVIAELFSLSPEPTGTLRNREWHDTAPAISPFPTTAGPGRNFRENHDFSLPVDTDTVVSSLALNDTNNAAARLDIQVLDGFIVVEQQMLARYSGASEGYWAVELGECCRELELLNESGGFSPNREMIFTLPKGIHQVRIWNIDSGGSNSSATFSYSLDGGLTWIADNTPPGIQMSQTKPNEICKKLKVCKDSGTLIGLLSGQVVDPASCYECSIGCDGSGQSSNSDGGTAEPVVLPETLRIV